MSRATGTLVLIAVVVAGTFAGAWWARSLAPTAPRLVVMESVRTHLLEVVDSSGNVRIRATANSDFAGVTIQGTAAGAPTVHVVADNARATVVVSAGEKTQRVEVGN